MSAIAVMPERFSRRREKVFGQGRCLPLDGNAKARIMVYARAWSARHRRLGQHRGRGRFGIRVKSGHKPKRSLSEKAYLSGRWKRFPIQLKTLVFLSSIGQTISGHSDELSKIGDWPGDWTKLPQEQVVENQCFFARKCPCGHFLPVSRTYPL